MRVHGATHTARASALVAAGAAALMWTLGATASVRHPGGGARHDPEGAPAFGDLLAALGAWLLVACAAWCAALCVAATVEGFTDGRVPATGWVGCPVRLRRLLVASLGLALAGAGPACASGARDQGGGAPDAHLPVPARTAGATTTETATRAFVVVRPADTLWHIVAAHLRPGASDAEVVLQVARLHRANREVIGPDPDLIHPGQRLTLPRPPAATGPSAPRHPEETR